MCGHLIAAGYKATVFNRTAEKAKPLVEKGAKLADSPEAVAAASDVVFTIVGYPARRARGHAGPDGTLAGAKPGTVLVDMTTSEPALAIEIAQAARAKKVHAVDAPVSGGDVGAKEARLSIMIGGEKRSSMPCGRCSRPWARRSSTKGPPARASTPRWSTRS